MTTSLLPLFCTHAKVLGIYRCSCVLLQMSTWWEKQPTLLTSWTLWKGTGTPHTLGDHRTTLGESVSSAAISLWGLETKKGSMKEVGTTICHLQTDLPERLAHSYKCMPLKSHNLPLPRGFPSTVPFYFRGFSKLTNHLSFFTIHPLTSTDGTS